MKVLVAIGEASVAAWPQRTSGKSIGLAHHDFGRPPGLRRKRPGIPHDALASARIAILDDDEDNVVLLERTLRAGGYERIEAHVDPTTAVEALAADTPDLLMLDLHMPGLDGFAVLERLQRHTAGPVPLGVLVLTADTSAEARRRALATGARDVLTKPYDLTEVLLRVGGSLENSYLLRTLDEHVERLERSDERRLVELTRLAADLAHELRTPLYAIRGLTETMLYEDGLDETTRHDINTIDGVATAALEVVNRQIAAAQAASGRTPLTPGAVRLPELMQSLRQMLQPMADAHDTALRIDDTSELPHVHTDPVALAQILRNLLSNAIRHTFAGDVRLRTELRDGQVVAFSVEDTGVGVHEADRDRIFEPFAQAGEDVGRPGGLGLPLARRLARMLGGDVRLEPGTRAGSTFTATIAVGRSDGSVPVIL